MRPIRLSGRKQLFTARPLAVLAYLKITPNAHLVAPADRLAFCLEKVRPLDMAFESSTTVPFSAVAISRCARCGIDQRLTIEAPSYPETM